jgi:hypothetical protein
MNKTNPFQSQFSGFFNTPHLFKKAVHGMHPFLKTSKHTPIFNGDFNPFVRLGHRVERFVASELTEIETIKILSENYQVQNNKQTIGELDCLILDENQPIHLEIQFKYYLIDLELGTSEIDHCIGPMRRDSLNEKLQKLKTKQLPLLYSNEAKPLLDSLHLKAEDFIQKLYFKAQLFVPYGKEITLNTLNPDCIYGFYFSFSRLSEFHNCKFYLLKKQDWLLDVSQDVNWQTYTQILPELTAIHNDNYVTLVWIKQANGEISKCFITI